MAQLRVALAEFERLAVLQAEGHPPDLHRNHLGGAGVDQPEAGIVTGPADAVAGAEFDLLGPVDLAAAPPPADPLRLPGDRPAPAVFEQHLAGFVIDADYLPLVALLDADPFVGPVERTTTSPGP